LKRIKQKPSGITEGCGVPAVRSGVAELPRMMLVKLE